MSSPNNRLRVSGVGGEAAVGVGVMADAKVAPGVALPPMSVVVPVHNEARILNGSMGRLIDALNAAGVDFELVVCENGSSDDTGDLVARLASANPRVRLHQSSVADYGIALQEGIRRCRNEMVVLINIDFWDIGFMQHAARLLEQNDMVTGSKVMKGANDRRPLLRRAITRSFNEFLRLVFGFSGTDTHGLKAFRRSTVGPIADRCVTKHWIFDTELVLRCERLGLKVAEVPVHVEEIRQPGYGSLVKRMPGVIRNLFLLRRALES